MAKKDGVHATNGASTRIRRPGETENELKNNYRDLDYSLLKVNADEFSRMKAEVVNAKNAKRKLKVS